MNGVPTDSGIKEDSVAAPLPYAIAGGETRFPQGYLHCCRKLIHGKLPQPPVLRHSLHSSVVIPLFLQYVCCCTASTFILYQSTHKQLEKMLAMQRMRAPAVRPQISLCS